MCHHGNTGRDNALDMGPGADTTLELDRVDSRFLHEANGGVECFVGTSFVRPKRHIRHDEGALGSSHDSAAQGNKFLHRHGHGAVVTKHDVGGRIPHQQKVHTSAVKNPGAEVVIAGQPGNPDAFRLCLGKMTHSNALGGLTHGASLLARVLSTPVKGRQ